MLQQDPPAVELNNIEWLIFDEADKLFEEGKDGFRDQVYVLLPIIKLIFKPICFTVALM